MGGKGGQWQACTAVHATPPHPTPPHPTPPHPTPPRHAPPRAATPRYATHHPTHLDDCTDDVEQTASLDSRGPAKAAHQPAADEAADHHLQDGPLGGEAAIKHKLQAAAQASHLPPLPCCLPLSQHAQHRTEGYSMNE